MSEPVNETKGTCYVELRSLLPLADKRHRCIAVTEDRYVIGRLEAEGDMVDIETTFTLPQATALAQAVMDGNPTALTGRNTTQILAAVVILFGRGKI